MSFFAANYTCLQNKIQSSTIVNLKSIIFSSLYNKLPVPHFSMWMQYQLQLSFYKQVDILLTAVQCNMNWDLPAPIYLTLNLTEEALLLTISAFYLGGKF